MKIFRLIRLNFSMCVCANLCRSLFLPPPSLSRYFCDIVILRDPIYSLSSIEATTTTKKKPLLLSKFNYREMTQFFSLIHFWPYCFFTSIIIFLPYLLPRRRRELSLHYFDIESIEKEK